MRQTRLGSMTEALLNVTSGFVLAIIVWQLLAQAYGIPMPLARNLEITSIFTVVSVTRSYVWRRIFNQRLNR